jgi:penicillin-binding protein 1A
MVKEGYLSEADYEKYSAQPMQLKFHTADHKEGLAVYLREFLRRYMTAKKPDRALYPSWNMVKFYNDSINWESDPLYGWCNKNKKRNGDAYNIYTDGLKVYTTIDSRMQAYAEDAVYQHVAKYLQPAFTAENKKKPNAPFTSRLSQEQVRSILNRNMRQSDRYRALQESGASEEEIQRSFRTPVQMSVFTYHGSVDTTMTPLDSIKYYKSFLRSGFVSVCPQNGHVKAYVGGLNYEHFAYDMVMEGRRQVGSTIKPYLYSLAMENGFSPCDLAPNVQQTYIVAGQPWTPRNAGKARYGEMVTLKWGLQQSNNWISAYLMSKLSPEAFVDLLREYGIRNPEIHPSMSLCLGPCDISVGEMASAYTAFVNHGIRAALMFVTRIEDNEGNVIAQFQPRMNEVISEESAHKMLYMLQSVVDGGTAGRLRFRYNLKGQLAGKTGTTNNNSDAWFMGLTPVLVNACWVGGDDRDIHFDSMAMGQGASMALPIFALYMQKVYGDNRLGYSEDTVFDIPASFNPCPLSDEESSEDDMNGIEEIFE